MALNQDRNTPMKDGEIVSVPVAVAKIWAGSLVAINAAGYATPGAVAATLKYFGRAEEQVDNSDGAAGDQSVLVRRLKAFKWLNHGADPVVQADLGANCYIVDDQTVAKTSGGDTRSVAGKVIQVDSDGIWVE